MTSDDDFLDVRAAPDPSDNFGIEVSEDVSPIEMGLKLDPSIFRAYDIRGIVTTNLTEDVVYWIGRAFAAEAKQHKMPRAVIGCDGRLSSPALKKSLARGLTEGGIDVTDIGEVPTPLLYYATHALDTGTGDHDHRIAQSARIQRAENDDRRRNARRRSYSTVARTHRRQPPQRRRRRVRRDRNRRSLPRPRAERRCSGATAEGRRRLRQRRGRRRRAAADLGAGLRSRSAVLRSRRQFPESSPRSGGPGKPRKT